MCKDVTCCEKPELLKGCPQDCSPEQIKECHGTDRNHPCVKGKKKTTNKKRNKS